MYFYLFATDCAHSLDTGPAWARARVGLNIIRARNQEQKQCVFVGSSPRYLFGSSTWSLVCWLHRIPFLASSLRLFIVQMFRMFFFGSRVPRHQALCIRAGYISSPNGEKMYGRID